MSTESAGEFEHKESLPSSAGFTSAPQGKVVILIGDYDGFMERIFQTYAEKLKHERKISEAAAEKIRSYYQWLFDNYFFHNMDGPVELYVGSARQSIRLDEDNETRNKNGSCFSNYKQLCTKESWTYRTFLLADKKANGKTVDSAMHNKELDLTDGFYAELAASDGYGFAEKFALGEVIINENLDPVQKERFIRYSKSAHAIYSDKIYHKTGKPGFDPEKEFSTFVHDIALKITMLKAQFDDIAHNHPNRKIEIRFGDDRKEIVGGVQAYFAQNLHLLPPNAELHIFQGVDKSTYTNKGIRDRCEITELTKDAPIRSLKAEEKREKKSTEEETDQILKTEEKEYKSSPERAIESTATCSFWTPITNHPKKSIGALIVGGGAVTAGVLYKNTADTYCWIADSIGISTLELGVAIAVAAVVMLMIASIYFLIKSCRENFGHERTTEELAEQTESLLPPADTRQATVEQAL